MSDGGSLTLRLTVGADPWTRTQAVRQGFCKSTVILRRLPNDIWSELSIDLSQAPTGIDSSIVLPADSSVTPVRTPLALFSHFGPVWPVDMIVELPFSALRVDCTK